MRKTKNDEFGQTKGKITNALTVEDIKNIHWMQILWSFVAKRVPMSGIHWPSGTSLLMNASW